MSAGAELSMGSTGSPWDRPKGMWECRGACSWLVELVAAAVGLLSVLFLPGTPVLLNASTEALPTVQLSNASLAFRPGS